MITKSIFTTATISFTFTIFIIIIDIVDVDKSCFQLFMETNWKRRFIISAPSGYLIIND